VTLHPLSTHFAAVAGAYERGRAEYAPAVIARLSAELHLPAGAPVLDLAAGTGKLTRALLAGGLDVIAVEPQPSLRALLAASVGAERVQEGTAEAIPLPDRSVAAVTVADAFHWFDHHAAVREIGRVLRPGGGLAVISTLPDWSGASWSHEVGTLLLDLRPEHPQFDGPSWQQAVLEAGGWTAPRELDVTTMHAAQPERIVDFIASISWMAALPEDQRSETLARIAAIVAAGETPAELPVRVVIGLTALV
jgi:SAM-dependent methyltransferase